MQKDHFNTFVLSYCCYYAEKKTFITQKIEIHAIFYSFPRRWHLSKKLSKTLTFCQFSRFGKRLDDQTLKTVIFSAEF